MKIRFGDKIVNDEAIISIHQSGQLFDGEFKLGSTLCRTLEIGIRIDEAITLGEPNEVIIFEMSESVEIPLFTMLIDTINKENKKYWVYKLIDKMVLLNTIYDWSALEDITVSNIVKQICIDILNMSNDYIPFIPQYPAILELPFKNNIMARDFIGWVAECIGGFARINNAGNLEFINYLNANVYPCNINSCEDLTIGDEHRILKVIYDNNNIHLETNRSYLFEDRVIPINNTNNEYLSINAYSTYFNPLSNGNIELNNIVNANKINFILDKETPDVISIDLPDITWGGYVYCDNDDGTIKVKKMWEKVRFNGISRDGYVNYLKQKMLPPYDLWLGIIPSYFGRTNLSKGSEGGIDYYEITVIGQTEIKYYQQSQIISDKFPIGEIKLINVREYLSNGGAIGGINDIPTQDVTFRFYNPKENIGLDINEDDNLCTNFKNYLRTNDITFMLNCESEELTLQTTAPLINIPSEEFIFKSVAINNNESSALEIDGELFNHSVKIEGELSDTIDEGNILRLNNENPLLKDISYNEFMILAKRIKLFRYYSFKTSRCEINDNVYAGSIVNFSDNEKSYPIIAQINWNYNTMWYGGYDTWLDNKFQEETKIYSLSEQIANQQSRIEMLVLNLLSGYAHQKISVDLNEIIEPGVYYVNCALADAEILNYPKATGENPVNGVLVVYNGASEVDVRQMFYRRGTLGVNDYQIYTRHYNGSNWSRWYWMMTDVGGVYNGDVMINFTNANAGEVPSSNLYSSKYSFVYDNTKTRMALLEAFRLANGRYGVQLYCYKDDRSIGHALGIGFDANGNREIYVTEPNAWRKALETNITVSQSNGLSKLHAYLSASGSKILQWIRDNDVAETLTLTNNFLRFEYNDGSWHTYFDLEDNVYKVNDSVSLTLTCSGYITSSGNQLNIGVIFPKSIRRISTFTFSKMTISLRIPSGGYVVQNGYNAYADSSVTISSTKESDCELRVALVKSGGWGLTNNIPVCGNVAFTVKMT